MVYEAEIIFKGQLVVLRWPREPFLWKGTFVGVWNLGEPASYRCPLVIRILSKVCLLRSTKDSAGLFDQETAMTN